MKQNVEIQNFKVYLFFTRHNIISVENITGRAVKRLALRAKCDVRGARP